MPSILGNTPLTDTISKPGDPLLSQDGNTSVTANNDGTVSITKPGAEIDETDPLSSLADYLELGDNATLDDVRQALGLPETATLDDARQAVPTSLEATVATLNDLEPKLDATQRNLLAYTSGTTLALGTAVYRSALNADGTFPTITDSGIPTAAAYYQFELELAVPSTVPSTITGPSGWTWLDGHGLPDPADLSGGETICISVRLDCTARTFLASVWRVA